MECQNKKHASNCILKGVLTGKNDVNIDKNIFQVNV